MKHLRIALEQLKRPTMAGLGLAVGALVLSISVSAPALAGKPVCPGDPRCKDDESTQYDFKFIFAGTDSIFIEHNNGVPWAVTRPAKNLGAIVSGPVPIHEDRIAWIGDAFDPCDMSGPSECSDRFSGKFLEAKDITFAATGEGGNDPGHVGLFFSFEVRDAWWDSENPIYEYVVKPQGLAHLVTHPWDPTDPDFCVPMAFDRTWILQYTPVIRQRQKKCPDSQYFEVCEADDAEEQWPFISEFFSEFRTIIWRADHPNYDFENEPLTPPCGF